MLNPNRFYNIETLLNKVDINNDVPEIYIISGNRSGGKTTSVTRFFVSQWLKGEYKEVMFLTRWANEIRGTAETMLNQQFLNYFFPELGNDVYVDVTTFNKIFYRIHINDKMFGWVCAVNTSDKIKRYSKLFSNVDAIFFDEFIPETGMYCPNEVDKFRSIHVSVARGINEQSRYVPVFMASNYISVINPYYLRFGLSERITPDARFIRGEGFVFEQNMNKGAQTAQIQSRFLRAFGNDSYYTGERVYLNDNMSLISRPNCATAYILTIHADGKDYGVRSGRDGMFYVSESVDNQFPIRTACKPEDVTEDFPYLTEAQLTLKVAFLAGRFRFTNQTCKAVLFRYFSYRI